ncbi:hypothetical protein CH289_07660 [Rhodococcus sp. RS1C4]|nr:minor capsid protein [Rhodococcus sp. RS1C4]OZC55062.1 hypothetical protein CH289_07660 [Rhodococcus sp. RS1C4]
MPELTWNRITDALATAIRDAGLARWNPNGTYTGTGAPALYVGHLPDSPSTAIMLNIYEDSRERDPDRANPDIKIQIRMRGDNANVRPVNDLGDKLFALLDDKTRYVLPGGVRVLHSRRLMAAPLGADTKQRQERADSYEFSLNPG